MKSIVNQKEFPKLMQHVTCDLIVLFSSQEHGTVMNLDQDWEQGYYSRSWNMEKFKDFNGTVTLSND